METEHIADSVIANEKRKPKSSKLSYLVATKSRFLFNEESLVLKNGDPALSVHQRLNYLTVSPAPWNTVSYPNFS